MMKYVCVIVLAILVAKSQADIDEDLKKLENKFRDSANECNSTSGASETEIVNMLRTGKADGKSGCFVFCIAQQFEVVKKDNTFDKDKFNTIYKPVIEKMKKENMEDKIKPVQSILNNCLDKQTATSDGCTSGKNIAECVMQGLQKSGIHNFNM